MEGLQEATAALRNYRFDLEAMQSRCFRTTGVVAALERCLLSTVGGVLLVVWVCSTFVYHQPYSQ